MTIHDAKDIVAQNMGYQNWTIFYDWIARDGERPDVVAQQIESAMTNVIEVLIKA